MTSVDELYANVDVTGQIRRQLPAGERGLAGPLSAALRGVAQQGVERLLAEPAVQRLWADAVYRAHRELVAIVENRRKGVTVSNGRAVLDLRPIVLRAGERIGLGDNLAQLLPANAGQVTILRSHDLATAQRATRVLNAVADWLWVLAVACFAAAVWIARGARRATVRAIAAGLVVAGIGLLVLRSLAGHYVVDSLVPADSARAAAATTWSVLTARLADSAWTTIAVGAVALAGLWLQGSASSCFASRRRANSPEQTSTKPGPRCAGACSSRSSEATTSTGWNGSPACTRRARSTMRSSRPQSGSS